MVEQDYKRFARCYNGLTVAFNKTPDADQAIVYFEALMPLPIDSIEVMALRYQRSGREWFPKAPEWYADAAKHAHDAEKVRLERELVEVPEPYCSSCDDTSWQPYVDAKGVERRKRCECLAVNPRLRKRLLDAKAGHQGDETPITTAEAERALTNAGWSRR